MSQGGGGKCRFCIDPKCKGTYTAEESKLRTAVLADLVVEACAALGLDPKQAVNASRAGCSVLVN